MLLLLYFEGRIRKIDDWIMWLIEWLNFLKKVLIIIFYRVKFWINLLGCLNNFGVVMWYKCLYFKVVLVYLGLEERCEGKYNKMEKRY